MRLITGYDVLMTTLKSITTVVSDSMSSEDMRNIVFHCSEEGLKIVGINQLITYREKIEVGDFRVTFDEEDKLLPDNSMIFQLNAKEFTDFLNSFQGSRRTVPSDIIFETKQGGLKISLTVVENSNDNPEVKNESVWMFSNIALKQNTFVALSQEIPDEDSKWSTVETNTILYYTTNMLPVMTKEGTSTLYNVLTFGSDFVVAFHQWFNTLMANVLPDELKGISLNYRAVSFMKSVICSVDTVKISKTATQLVFKTDKSEAFINFMTKLPSYKTFVDGYKEDSGIRVDRQYLKDVLKRLSLVNESITFNISPERDTIKVSNSKFSQEIPILSKKDMDLLGDVTIKVRPQVIQNAIIGDDTQFPAETYMYFVKGATSGYTVIFTDESKQWISLAALR